MSTVETTQEARPRKGRAAAFAKAVGRFLFAAVTTYFGLLAVTFFIGRVVPIDPVLAILGDRAPAHVVERVRREMGFDLPDQARKIRARRVLGRRAERTRGNARRPHHGIERQNERGHADERDESDDPAPPWRRPCRLASRAAQGGPGLLRIHAPQKQARRLVARGLRARCACADRR